MKSLRAANVAHGLQKATEFDLITNLSEVVEKFEQCVVQSTRKLRHLTSVFKLESRTIRVLD